MLFIALALLFDSFVLSFDELVPSNSFNSDEVERIVIAG
jgi:hypothetical protein